MATFVAMLGAGIIAPLMAVFAEGFGATGIWLGAIFSAFGISRFVFTPYLGRLSDTRGRKRILLLGLIAYSATSFAYALAGSVFELVAVRFVHGVASAMIAPVAMAYAGEMAPRGREGAHMGFFMLSFFLGFGLGPVIGGFMAGNFGFASAFYAMGAISSIGIPLVFFFLPESSGRRAQGGILPMGKMLRNSTVRAVVIFRTASFLGVGSVFAFLAIYAVSIGLSVQDIGLLFAISIFAMAGLQVVFGRLSDRFGRLALMSLGGLLAALPLFLIPGAQSFGELLILFLLMGSGWAMGMASSLALLTEVGRNLGMGSVMGVSDSSTSIGMFIGPIISGIVMDLAGVGLVFILGGVFGLAGLFAFLVAIRSSIRH